MGYMDSRKYTTEFAHFRQRLYQNFNKRAYTRIRSVRTELLSESLS